ncbi:MAG: hypothetical protein FWD64_14375, partial [Acidobacteriaceae bacterium]|nr:hypothetical protein [Acidobacteriaceae bacterium]
TPDIRLQRVANPATFKSAFYGNEMRNLIRLPGTSRTNASLFKEFDLLREGVRLQLRVESFNVIGNVNLNTPRTDLATISSTANIATPSFVQLQSAEPMRIFQFGARLMF